jgi:hypothetical protein
VVLPSVFVGSVFGGQQRLKGVGSTPWKWLRQRSLTSPSSSSLSEVISTGSPPAEVSVADRTRNRSWTEAQSWALMAFIINLVLVLVFLVLGVEVVIFVVVRQDDCCVRERAVSDIITVPNSEISDTY